MNTMPELIHQAPRETDPFLEKFQRFERDGAARHPSWLFPIRKAALARFAELGFPTLHDEDWRFTNISSIARLPFKPVFDRNLGGLTQESLRQFHFAGLNCNRLVFINGHFCDGTDLSCVGQEVLLLKFCRDIMAEKEIEGGAWETPTMSPVSCCGKNPLGMTQARIPVKARVARVAKRVKR